MTNIHQFSAVFTIHYWKWYCF